MKCDTIRTIANIVLAVAVFTVWILNFFLWRNGPLGGGGLSDLRFFTVESNLLVGFVAVAWLVARTMGQEGAKWLSVLKYVSTVAVFVTFAVVVLFLGPVYGYSKMYYGANLFFHLIIPLAAIAEYVFLEKDTVSFRESFYAMIPTVIYGIGYVANCMINGIGEWPDRNDWYSFLEWGYGVGVVVFIVICALAWGLGLLLRLAGRAAHRIGRTQE